MIFVLSSGNKQRLTSCFKILGSCDPGVTSSWSCRRSKLSRSVIGDDCAVSRGGRLYDNGRPEFCREFKTLRPAELLVETCRVIG